MKITVVFAIFTFCSLFIPSHQWFSRRRRSCSASNCQVSGWGGWSRCTRSCGGGTQTRTRRKTVIESCGGGCSYKFTDSRNCNTYCCPRDCSYSWYSWSPCRGCGKSTQTRSPNIHASALCGGKACPGKQTRSCDTGV